MATTRIGVLVGSLSRESINRRLADALASLAPSGFSMRTIRLDDLPLYNRDDDARPPEPVKRLKREIGESDGILFVTPEYNRSIPGTLKNALDHASRPYGQSVGGQAGRRRRRVERRARHVDGAAAPAQHPRLPRHAHARAA